MARLMLVFCLGVLVWCELGVWGCRKEEKPIIMDGVVLDAKTSVTMDSVTIYYDTHPKNDDDFHQVSSHVAMTNGEGKFSIELQLGKTFTGSVRWS